MIDLRSDTCSRPTEAMRRAMAVAAVGIIGLRSKTTTERPLRASA